MNKSRKLVHPPSSKLLEVKTVNDRSLLLLLRFSRFPKRFFICCMPIGQLPDTLIDCFLKTIFTNYCCFAEEQVCGAPNTTIPEVDANKIYT